MQLCENLKFQGVWFFQSRNEGINAGLHGPWTQVSPAFIVIQHPLYILNNAYDYAIQKNLPLSFQTLWALFRYLVIQIWPEAKDSYLFNFLVAKREDDFLYFFLSFFFFFLFFSLFLLSLFICLLRWQLESNKLLPDRRINPNWQG